MIDKEKEAQKVREITRSEGQRKRQRKMEKDIKRDGERHRRRDIYRYTANEEA